MAKKTSTDFMGLGAGKERRMVPSYVHGLNAYSVPGPGLGITRLGFGVSSKPSPEQQGLCLGVRRASWGCQWGSSRFL